MDNRGNKSNNIAAIKSRTRTRTRGLVLVVLLYFYVDNADLKYDTIAQTEAIVLVVVILSFFFVTV